MNLLNNNCLLVILKIITSLETNECINEGVHIILDIHIYLEVLISLNLQFATTYYI